MQAKPDPDYYHRIAEHLANSGSLRIGDPSYDGICRAAEYVWRRSGSFHETHSSEGAVILAIYRKPNIFQNSAGYDRRLD